MYNPPLRRGTRARVTLQDNAGKVWLAIYVCTYVGGCGLPGLVLHTTTSEAGACAAHVDAVS